MLVGLCSVIEPVERRHGHDIVTQKTQMGRHEWNVSMASGASGEYLLDSLLALMNHDVLINMGVVTFREHCTSTTLAEDMAQKVLDSMFAFWRNLVAKELSFIRSWSARMPGLVFTQLSRDEGTRQAGLMQMRKLFEKLEQWEPIAATDKALRDDMANLEWPLSTWSREILLSGAEMNWECLPRHILDEVQEASRVVSSSKLIEDMSNMVRGQAEGVRNGRQSTQTVWHTCMHADLMADCDLAPVHIESSDLIQAGATLPNALFRAKDAQDEFSLGSGGKTRFFEQKDYPSMSIANYLRIPYKTEALLQASSVDQFRNAWLSQLAIEGSILYTGRGESGLKGGLGHVREVGGKLVFRSLSFRPQG